MRHDKRSRTRVPVHFNVRVSIGDTVIQEQIRNISLNGLLCTSSPLFQENAPCRLVIALNGDIRISVDARISRVGAEETAIRFLGMDDGSFMHLRRLVQYNAGDADRIDLELHQRAFEGA